MDQLDPPVVAKILSYFLPNELRKLSHVCTLWNKIVDQVLRKNVTFLEFSVDETSTLCRLMKPWKTKQAKLNEMFELLHHSSDFSQFDPIHVNCLLISCENSSIKRTIPFDLLTNICRIGDFCVNIEMLVIPDFIVKYDEELSRINEALPGLLRLVCHDIGESCRMNNLHCLNLSSSNGILFRFLFDNPNVNSLQIPFNFGVLHFEDVILCSSCELNRISKLHLTSLIDLKGSIANALFKNLLNLETLKLENALEMTFCVQALIALKENLHFLSKLTSLSIEEHNSQRFVNNGAELQLYEMLYACKNLTKLSITFEVSKPTLICQAIAFAADQSQLEYLTVDLRASNAYVDYSGLFKSQLLALKGISLRNVAKSNILTLILKKCPDVNYLRINKDDISESEWATFVASFLKTEYQIKTSEQWRGFTLEIQKTSRWYSVFIRALINLRVKYEVYASKIPTRKFDAVCANIDEAEINVKCGHPTIGCSAFRLWNNETKNVLAIYDLVKFTAYTDIVNYIFGRFNY